MVVLTVVLTDVLAAGLVIAFLVVVAVEVAEVVASIMTGAVEIDPVSTYLPPIPIGKNGLERLTGFGVTGTV
jgi:hypothetical protein